VKEEIDLLEPASQDEWLAQRLLELRQSVGDALAEHWRGFASLRHAFSRALWPPRWGIRLVGERPRADYTIVPRDGDDAGLEAGLARSVHFVFRFHRRDLDRLLDDWRRGSQQGIAQPWRVVRLILTHLRALRWRTPSGVLTDPRPIALGTIVLIAVLIWRFWPRAQRDR